MCMCLSSCRGQIPTDRASCQNPEFDKKVANMLNFSVKTVNSSTVKAMNDVVILDARERSEYDISHLPNAIFIGYRNFNKEILSPISKDKTIVVYCSIGYRSEKIGEKLRKLGFIDVNNLYGSIFEWVNEGNEVMDKNGQPTLKVHTYNKAWSKWVDNKNIEKIW